MAATSTVWCGRTVVVLATETTTSVVLTRTTSSARRSPRGLRVGPHGAAVLVSSYASIANIGGLLPAFRFFVSVDSDSCPKLAQAVLGTVNRTQTPLTD